MKFARHVVAKLFLLIFALTPIFSMDWTGEPPLIDVFENLDYQTWLPDAQPSPETAQRLNEIGFDRYQENNLIEAAKIWKAALEMDPNHYLAHYNYAAALAIFARGFGDFDASGPNLPDAAWDRDDFIDYRRAIIHHLKVSISLNPNRKARVKEDEDFDSIRNLETYRNMLMGPYPTVSDVLREAPKWYSLQPGAFLPEDTFTFFPDGTVVYEWDKKRYNVFPEVYKSPRDDSFTGSWRALENEIVIRTDSGQTLRCAFDHIVDELGFIVKRVLVFDGVKYGDYDAHYWEGQDA